MPETSNNQPDEKVTLDSLDNSSESFTDSLEKVEQNLNITDDNIKVSDDLRAAYLKINSLSRANQDNSLLESNYSKILDKYKELWDRSFSSQKEYLDATKVLLEDLWSLNTINWEKLSDKTIDWWLFEAWVALKDWVIKAWEKIYDELKWYFDMLWIPWDLPEIIEKIMWSLSFDTFSDIYKALVEMWWDITRDFSLILKNSTWLGKAVELSNFVPSVWIPLLFDSIWPWKFLKILKIEKYIPEKVLNWMNEFYEKWKNVVEKWKKVIEKSDKAEDIEKWITSDTIRNNFSISDNETRKIAAVDTLKQKYPDEFKWFSESQLNWIIEAHEIWKDLFKQYLEKKWLTSVDQLSDSQLKEIFNSKEWRIVLRQKMKKLKESWVDMKYSDDLIRSWITWWVEVDMWINIMTKETLKDLQQKTNNVLDNLAKFPEIVEKIKSRSLTPEDLSLLDDLELLAKSGHLSSEHVNKAVIDVIEKAKIWEIHPATEKLFADLKWNKIKKLEYIKSWEISNIPWYWLADDLYNKIDSTIWDINISETLEKVDWFFQIDASELWKVAQTMWEILKIDYIALFNSGVNINSIKPLEFILRYWWFGDPKITQNISLIVNKVKSGTDVSAEDIQYLKNNLKGIGHDDRLMDIKKWNFEKANMKEKNEISIGKVEIPLDKVMEYWSFWTFLDIKMWITSLLSYWNNWIKNLLNDWNKNIVNQLLEIKDNLWEKVDNVDWLKKALHQNTERKSILESIWLNQSDIDLLDQACLI